MAMPAPIANPFMARFWSIQNDGTLPLRNP